MEWDMNTPWYRPTRVNVVPSGAEFGWRNGGGKWPAYYPDSLPAVVNIGPGSPTGVAFGYGAKFPAKYQNALYVADWSYGKLYAVHLEPKGSSWKAEFEEFMSAQPASAHRPARESRGRSDVYHVWRSPRPVGALPCHLFGRGKHGTSRGTGAE